MNNYKVTVDDKGTTEIWSRNKVVKHIIERVPDILGDSGINADMSKEQMEKLIKDEMKDVKKADPWNLIAHWSYYVDTKIEGIPN